MRSLNDLIEAVLTLGGATADRLSSEQLDAAAQITAGISTALSGLSKLQLKSGAWADVIQEAVEKAPAAYEEAKKSGGTPFQMRKDQAEAEGGIVALRPGFDPPPDAIKCEEADAQRADLTRIATLKADGILYLEKVLYYTQLFAAAVEAVADPTPDKLYEAGNTHMLSLECLPGSRPALAEEDLVQGRALWLQSYRTIKALVDVRRADAEDEVTVLFKLADAPEGTVIHETVEAVDG